MDRRGAAGDKEGADARDEVDQQEDHAHRVISCYAARRKEACGVMIETFICWPFSARGVGRILREGAEDPARCANGSGAAGTMAGEKRRPPDQ